MAYVSPSNDSSKVRECDTTDHAVEKWVAKDILALACVKLTILLTCNLPKITMPFYPSFVPVKLIVLLNICLPHNRLFSFHFTILCYFTWCTLVRCSC